MLHLQCHYCFDEDQEPVRMASPSTERCGRGLQKTCDRGLVVANQLQALWTISVILTAYHQPISEICAAELDAVWSNVSSHIHCNRAICVDAWWLRTHVA